MGHPGSQAPEGRGTAGGSCPHCGSGELITGLKVNQNAEVGRIGLAYKAALLFVGTEELHADLCRACGSIVRFFVKETNRNWIH